MADVKAELRRQVETQNPPPEDGYSQNGELLSLISTLLHSPASSGELRAALQAPRYRAVDRLRELVFAMSTTFSHKAVRN